MEAGGAKMSSRGQCLMRRAWCLVWAVDLAGSAFGAAPVSKHLGPALERVDPDDGRARKEVTPHPQAAAVEDTDFDQRACGATNRGKGRTVDESKAVSVSDPRVGLPGLVSSLTVGAQVQITGRAIWIAGKSGCVVGHHARQQQMQ
jgi:hypothetical protein